MFNRDEKIAFLATLKSKSVATSTFEKLAPYEEENGCDLALMDIEPLQKALDETAYARAESNASRMSALRLYVKWRERNNLPTTRNMFQVKAQSSEAAAKTYLFASPSHLIGELNRFFEYDLKQPSVDCIYRSYFWLAYMGIEDWDAVTIRKRDVNLKKMVIRCGYDEYSICPEAYDDISSARNAKELLYVHPQYTIMRPRAESDLLLIGFKVYPDIVLRLRNAITKRTLGAKTPLTYRNVFLSGVFYRMYQDEMMGLPVDFTSEIVDKLKRERMLGKKRDRQVERNLINKLNRDYLKNYKEWKNAFF